MTLSPGGHSLAAMRIISQIHAVLQRDIPLHTFLASRNITQLAQAIEAHKVKSAGPALQIRQGPEPSPASFWAATPVVHRSTGTRDEYLQCPAGCPLEGQSQT